MTRAVVNVATDERSQRGQARLEEGAAEFSKSNAFYPFGAPTWERTQWPAHHDKPYAFKAYALNEASEGPWDILLWCDASVMPIRSMEPLWERIEREGYWLSDQAMVGTSGWSNYEWTADGAYPDLFSDETIWPHGSHLSPEMQRQLYGWGGSADPTLMEKCRSINKTIPHVIAGCFGLNMRHPIGKAFLDEYYRLASETRAFCGPWINAAWEGLPKPLDVSNEAIKSGRYGVCGPPDVRGHRHDQTAASVIAWRLGMKLTYPPAWIAYKGYETEETIMLVDGSYA